VESCEVCGFVWDDVADADVEPRIRAGSEMIARLLRNAPDVADARPTPGRWSMLEYAAHVRDVLLVVRDRFVVGVVADRPGFAPMYREERVDLGMYQGEEPLALAAELEVAATLVVRMIAALSPEQLERTCEYGFPAPTTRTLRWMAAQAVHEVEHHLSDVEQNLTLVTD
jgi:DinB family protein